MTSRHYPTARIATLLLIGAIASSLAFGQTTEEVTFSSGDLTLMGTLTLPEGSAPHPAIVLISGSGPQDRDNAHPSLPGYRPFAQLAERLAAEGVAVLRYDERGVGASGGDHASATSFDLADDVEAAVAFLRDRGEIDADRVGLLGHSEGAWLAALVAARDDGVAFVVALAGHAVTGAELLPVQAERGLRATGTPEEQIETIVASQRAEIDLIATQDWDVLEQQIHEQTLAAFAAMPEEQRTQLGDLETAAQAQVERSMIALRGWLHTFVTGDPADAWSAVAAPVLAVFGSLDTQVDLEQNRPPLEAALERARNDDVTVVVVPSANHLFQAATSAGDDYASLSPEMMPEVVDAVADWLSVRLD